MRRIRIKTPTTAMETATAIVIFSVLDLLAIDPNWLRISMVLLV